ncbi:MAG TPA: hypothetical protein PLN05_10530 [Pyrinomonadaceae bacterium]|mgnify:CR=1 FL=1|nr:hypothetical protein [Chloracidobacterium sp.]HBE82797.1 hypothetical protein [Blastocatellia bacterium]HRJ87233.1 hypothetical protein [Pyrinomonadaceae bacterium]HRK50853.1 hypothetical protein [Pyrinomonadaceae bacterium]
MKKWLLRMILPAIGIVAVLFLAYLQVEHRYNYGHLFGYGVHVDAVSRYSYIGIPGQTHMYNARIFNFTLLPVGFDTCGEVRDALMSQIEFPYGVQRWDDQSNSWITSVADKSNKFCHPDPLNAIETNVVTRWIWPGMSVDVSSGEATAARHPFQQGNLARFVVFRKLGTENDWQYAIPSEPFIIVDNVIRDNNSNKVAH